MVFDDSIKFCGTYRPYQQRVLDNLEAFLDNEKIHVVAAPGSGKTILGLELIKRLDQNSLILTPSIAIREQWINRFANNFLEDSSTANKWISNSLYEKRPMISITYQALYFAYIKEKNRENVDDISEEETDYSQFDLIKMLKDYNIKTICLDECHHLKFEWWKVLENIISQIDGCKIIALTATPPYDSTNQEWQKYIDLCGPIDEEIFVPELIKDHNLCPHQDYVYFSFPTEEEEKEIMNLYSKGLKIYNKYKNDPTLLSIISSNKIYKDFNSFKKRYYDNIEYYQALITYLMENKVSIPLRIRLLIDKKTINENYFEILLQNVLFEDKYSYPKNDKLLSIKKELSALGVIYNRKVHLVTNEKIDKKITFSLSKLTSIKEIVQVEEKTLKSNLRCLILTDYVKIKSKAIVGNNNKKITSFGTIPIFEYLRRENLNNVSLCCLSGSICILPAKCLTVIDKDLEYSYLSDKNYIELTINVNNRKKIVALVTKLFENGIFNVLIATKSLLGEGWDSPCINSLIMASFIGTYVLSNQMRGRAIRAYDKDPNKKANVWHLVCLNPFDYHFSYDYFNLEKRFSSFIGIDFTNQQIENGLERLGITHIPYNRIEMQNMNEYFINKAQNREEVANIWESCLEKAENISMLTKITYLPKKRLNYDLSFFNSLISAFLSLILVIVNYDLYLNLLKHNMSKIAVYILTIFFAVLFIFAFTINFIKSINLISPKKKLKTIGKATLKAMIKTKNINSKNVNLVVKKAPNNYLQIYLLNATTFEQNIFSNAIMQIFDKVGQPRYLIAKPKLGLQTEFYIVPDIFKKNKEMVKIFEKELAKIMGGFAIIFAKNEAGRNIVLRAQKIYSIKYHQIDIKTKNILLKKRSNDY